jgi:tRNA-splicing ligase RtcB
MKTHGLVFASDAMMATLRGDPALMQVRNVAELPGIIGPSIAMPDIHWGYGFPIGGVAAMDPERGVVSPGGIGYDINCGVRLLRVPLHGSALARDLPARLARLLAEKIPSGVGSHRRDLQLSRDEECEAVREGARWAVRRGFGRKEDLAFIEEGGTLANADPEAVSDRALVRGQSQLVPSARGTTSSRWERWIASTTSASRRAWVSSTTR